MNILAIGQSHIGAIREAARLRREAAPEQPRTRVIHTLEPQYAPEIIDGGFAAALEVAIRDQIARHAPRVISVMGGNYHNALALIRHEQPFDFRLSGEAGGPPIDPGAAPLPEALVHAALLDGVARDRERLRLLRSIVGPFVHVESPPPVRDDVWVAAQADRWFRERGLAMQGVAPAGLRWRMWRLNGRVFRAEVEALGCRFLPVPAEAQDANGFLRPELAADATHGNGAYGEILIRAIERG